MKPQLQKMLLSLMLCPLTANASVVLDPVNKLTTLLGHAPAVTNIYEAKKQGLDSSSAGFQPWAGSFWPDINGGITNHYRDHGKFGSQINFVLRYEAAKGRVRRDHEDVCTNYKYWDIDQLSKKLAPSEKYDLLIGNTNFEFTRAIAEEMEFRADYRITTKKTDGSETDSDANEGVDNNYFYEDAKDKTYERFDSQFAYRYWRKKGSSLAYWSGICDGWAPASIYLPRPVKPVTLRAANGQMITFYPDDIKALGSYLFARTNTPYFTTMNYQFAGRKCDEGSPELDEAGYVKDIRCNDLDAGVWHLSLLNRIGKDKMGFIFDIDNNLKINNHPIAGYELSYFNPDTGERGSLERSMVPIHKVKDKYSKRRKRNAKYLVGVKSKIKYLNYYWPEKNRKVSHDHDGMDKLKKQEYVYDLELDEKGNILGGEWGNRADDVAAAENASSDQKPKSDEQPDFIWMASLNVLPYSEMADFANPGLKKDPNNPRPFGNVKWAWDGQSAMPDDWIAAARSDMTWIKPVSVDDKDDLESTPDAKNSVLKSAQPLSHIVYYLFDQARASNQK